MVLLERSFKMKKYLSIFFISIFLISIFASVSDDLQQKVRTLTGGNSYSASMVPVPQLPVQKDNLAVKDTDSEITKDSTN
jgi:hypothetical protein